jgi:hypothetical protein
MHQLLAVARVCVSGSGNKMTGYRDSVIIALLAALFAIASPTVGSRAQSGPDDALAAGSIAGSSVRVTGNAASLKIDVRHATVEQVLSALGGVNVRYRSSETLDEAVDGIFAGSDRQVLARVLDGYNYAIKQEKTKLEVVVFGKRGDHAVPAAIVIPIRRRPSD